MEQALLPYRHEASGEVPVPWGRLQYLQSLAPAGGIDASVKEMARYALFQLDDGTMAGVRVLSSQMMAELHRPEIAVGADWTPAASFQSLHYALGWFTTEAHGVHLVSISARILVSAPLSLWLHPPRPGWSS